METRAEGFLVLGGFRLGVAEEEVEVVGAREGVEGTGGVAEGAQHD